MYREMNDQSTQSNSSILYDVDLLVPHPRNTEFFDDITGEAWEEFKESVASSGVIQPITVVKGSNTIISGHQRVRAIKELGQKEVPVVFIEVADEDGNPDEDAVLRMLIETNLQQRGIGNPNPVKLGRCIDELERIYGIRSGSANEKGTVIGESNHFTDGSIPKTEAEFAGRLGMTRQSLQNYKKFAKMPPEIQEFLTSGSITQTTALHLARQLSPEEQIALISSLKKDQKYTEPQIKKMMTSKTENKKKSDTSEKASEELPEKAGTSGTGETGGVEEESNDFSEATKEMSNGSEDASEGEELKSLQNQIDDLTAEVIQLQNLNDDLTTQLAGAKEEISRLKEKLSEYEREEHAIMNEEEPAKTEYEETIGEAIEVWSADVSNEEAHVDPDKLQCINDIQQLLSLLRPESKAKIETQMAEKSFSEMPIYELNHIKGVINRELEKCTSVA